jgi:hypothetical protein
MTESRSWRSASTSRFLDDFVRHVRVFVWQFGGVSHGSTAEQAQQEMWDRAHTEREPDESKPTVRQIYAIARGLCEQAGKKWPATRRDASALIERLRDGATG